MTEKEAFIAGWEAGYHDGGEHDCRMFTPTAERAWKNYVHSIQQEKLSLSERVKFYRCTGCLGPVQLIAGKIVCIKGCKWGNQYQENP